jgi:hypothetical protein
MRTAHQAGPGHPPGARPVPRPGRRPVRRLVLPVLVLAGLVLAACTAGQPGKPATGPGAASQPGRHGGLPLGHQGTVNFRPGGKIGPGGRPGVVFFIGPGGPGGAVLALPPGGLGSNTSRPHISLAPIPPAGSTQAVALPLDSYEQVAVQEQQALAAAGDQLTARCMAAAGFSYPVAAQPGAGAANVQSIEGAGYGVASLTEAESYGYSQAGPGVPPGSLVALPGFVTEQQKHGAAWTSALLGFVPGARAGARQHTGCLQAADTALYGSLNGNPNPDPVPGIALQAAQWTQSYPLIVAVERAWSACMARSGLRYRNPGQAQDRNWPATPTPAEIATAVADVRCKTQTNLVNTWLTVEAAYQAALISQNLTALARLEASFGRLLSRAETLLRLPSAAGIVRASQVRPGQRGPVINLP